MTRLAENSYGKSRVRLVKVTRTDESHEVREWNVGVYLTGHFSAVFVAGDNAGVMATDTMKNTVYVVAARSTAITMEAFAIELGAFLLERSARATSVRVTIEEKPWLRMKVQAADGTVSRHDTAFLQRGPEVHTCVVTLQRGVAPAVISGVKGLVILKTAHSAFRGFERDALTTLPDSNDRLMGTEAAIEWGYASQPADFAATRTRMLETVLTTFAEHRSLSVQHTLYAMAEAGLTAIPEALEMTLTMPNRHNIPFDLSRYGLENRNEIFVPQDEPHGLITARVVR